MTETRDYLIRFTNRNVGGGVLIGYTRQEAKEKLRRFVTANPHDQIEVVDRYTDEVIANTETLKKENVTSLPTKG